MKIRTFIGIDDTDNLESRGTGFRARQLGETIEAAGLGTLICVTRHQLLVNPAIPYTSHNSSASLLIETAAPADELIEHCRNFLLRESADGSDAGLCIASESSISEKIIEWGQRAKKEVLFSKDAHTIAHDAGIFLEGLTGEKIGVIGSLAAIGLRKWGNDGRVLWLRNLRELRGIIPAKDLITQLGLDALTDKNGVELPPDATIDTGQWMRPVMVHNKITIFAERKTDYGTNEWQIASKDFIKGISE
ncbi:MAG: ABC transporter substrate-binding protein [Bacteroidota bacterium]